jgi:hypothetical protein
VAARNPSFSGWEATAKLIEHKIISTSLDSSLAICCSVNVTIGHGTNAKS